MLPSFTGGQVKLNIMPLSEAVKECFECEEIELPVSCRCDDWFENGIGRIQSRYGDNLPEGQKDIDNI